MTVSTATSHQRVKRIVEARDILAMRHRIRGEVRHPGKSPRPVGSVLPCQRDEIHGKFGIVNIAKPAGFEQLGVRRLRKGRGPDELRELPS